MGEPNATKKPLVYIVVGPTASGKTAYAVQLAKKVGGAVISADSRQVYAGMDSGTAKPVEAWEKEAHDILTPDTIDGIDHYLLNIASPDKPVTLAEWQGSAEKVIKYLLEKGVVPVIAGGTMLYIDSIVRNWQLPEVEPNEVRRQELEALPAEELRARLKKVDPEALEFIEPHNTRRMVRALEVIEVTGQPFSTQRIAQPSPYRFEITGLFPGWEVLEERITQRIKEMMTHGLLEETRTLQETHGADLPLLQTLNYKQVEQVLVGELSEEEARQEMVKENLRYAKRQMKWWRNRYLEEEIQWK